MLVKRAPRLNFVELILDLRRAPHRMKFSEISDAINVPVDTVKGWFYRDSTPNVDDGIAFLELHRLKTESCNETHTRVGNALQPASCTRVMVNQGPTQRQESTAMATTRKKSTPKNVRQPGEEPGAGAAAQEPGKSDPDAAMAQARSGGGARRIARPRAEVPPAKVKQVDSLRPKAMPVNQRTEMSYEEAMRLHESGEQTRAILTPQGWLAPPMKTPQSAKAGVA